MMIDLRGFPLRLAALAGLALGTALTAQADTTWKQVGFFRSDTRNLAVGDSLVRVVSLPDRNTLDLTGDFARDSVLAQRQYPGWDYMTDLVVFYRPTPRGYVQSSFEYGIGQERQPLAGDTIPTHLGIFDHQGSRSVDIPPPLRRMVGEDAWVVAAASADWDADGQREWVVAVSAAWNEGKGAPVTLSLCDLRDRDWFIERTFRIEEPARSGPLEIRDVTGDGGLDIVYRYFHETGGHFWIDARVYSRSENMPTIALPIRFDPGTSSGPAGFPD